MSDALDNVASSPGGRVARAYINNLNGSQNAYRERGLVTEHGCLLNPRPARGTVRFKTLNFLQVTAAGAGSFVRRTSAVRRVHPSPLHNSDQDPRPGVGSTDYKPGMPSTATPTARDYA
jgi:hypothetical protein